MEAELAACRIALEKARSRIVVLEEELHGHRTSTSRPFQPPIVEATLSSGILSSTPLLLHDRSTPISASATSGALHWMRQLRGAQSKSVQGCIDLQSAAHRLMSAGESFAASLRELSSLYASVDAASVADDAVACASAINSSSSLAAGAGMLAELLTEVTSFSGNLAASLDAVFVASVGSDMGAAFSQCMTSVKTAGRRALLICVFLNSLMQRAFFSQGLPARRPWLHRIASCACVKAPHRLLC